MRPDLVLINTKRPNASIEAIQLRRGSTRLHMSAILSNQPAPLLSSRYCVALVQG